MSLTLLTALRIPLALALAGASLATLADESGSVPSAPSPQGAASAGMVEHPLGAATKTYLNLQSSNTSAAPPRAEGGAEASLAYHRYLESFKHAIPEFFSSSTAKSGGGSGTAN